MLFCDAASYKNHIYTKLCKKGSLTTYISNEKKIKRKKTSTFKQFKNQPQIQH